MDLGPIFAKWPFVAIGLKWGGLCLVATLLAVMIRMSFARKSKGKPTHPVKVSITVKGFFVSVDDGASVMIRWIDIKKVTVITTDSGPWVDDFFYHIEHVGGDLTLPSEAGGMTAFVEKLITLPGFESEAYTQAIRSTENNTFVVCFKALT